MSLVALDGTPLVRMGAAAVQGIPAIAPFSATTLDAATEAIIMYGQVFTADGASHTINTTGSSALRFRTGAVTFANGATTLKVGLAAMDTTTGPPARAVNVADVITNDVEASLTGGGGGVSANAWQSIVPTTGTKTVANGDFLAFGVQMTARGGVDSVSVTAESVLSSASGPSATSFLSSVYAELARLPNCIIVFSDGVLGAFYGGYVGSIGSTTQTWNNTSGTKEYGNLFQLNFPAKCYGLYFGAAISGDVDAILYSDPLGTPAPEKSVSIDVNAVSSSSNRVFDELFAAPFNLAANTPYAAILKPTSASNIAAQYKTFNAAAEQVAESPGSATNGYAINRASGAFAAQNSSKDRFAIGLLVGAFEHGVQPTYAAGIV